MGSLVSVMTNLKTLLENVNDGGSPAKKYLDQVWIGQPKKIPMGAKHIAIVNPLSNPDFYYTTCNTNVQKDFVVEIVIATKGHIEHATMDNLTATEAVMSMLNVNPKINNTAVGSTIETVDYGGLGIADDKNLAIASKITFKVIV